MFRQDLQLQGLQDIHIVSSQTLYNKSYIDQLFLVKMNTVSQAHFALHKTLHKVQNF